MNPDTTTRAQQATPDDYRARWLFLLGMARGWALALRGGDDRGDVADRIREEVDHMLAADTPPSANDGWTLEWPTTPGLYFFYGGIRDVERRQLLICEVKRSGNAVLIYVAGGRFIYPRDTEGAFKPCPESVPNLATLGQGG